MLIVVIVTLVTGSWIALARDLARHGSSRPDPSRPRHHNVGDYRWE